MSGWSWIWPSVGGTPINQGLDSEMFDRVDYPYSETFVREAIQNSLDARLDMTKPVIIRFSFHEDRLGKRGAFLRQAMEHRQRANLPVPAGWAKERIKWIVVEDSNTKGLLGDLKDRKGDFWGYWLNFGVSNKTGTGRGGRGIGRVTFLIASQMHTVIGLTRRFDDKALAACGMSVLKADQYGSEFKSTHAYLAESEEGSIYKLHAEADFHASLVDAFRLSPYPQDSELTGLSLVIPFPHEELDGDGILAAAIDHFAPAILNGTLVVEVGVDRLDKDSIKQVAPCVSQHIKSKPVKGGIKRYLEMIEVGLAGSKSVIKLPDAKAKLSDQRNLPDAERFRERLANGETIVFELTFPMAKFGETTEVGLTVVAAPKPYEKMPLDRLFREGMSLPDVRSRRHADIDLIMLIEREPLAQYLNFCEGKAHLDLLESKEVRTKLADAGFDGIHVKRLVKSLPDDLREFLTEESTEPDRSVWEGYFSVPDPSSPKKKVPKPAEKDPNSDPPTKVDPPKANPSAMLVDALEDGFCLNSNPDYSKFPAQADVTVAYADGSGKPSWSEFDFRFDELEISSQNCAVSFTDNRLRIKDWVPGSMIEVKGFDTRRELDIRIRTESNASAD